MYFHFGELINFNWKIIPEWTNQTSDHVGIYEKQLQGPETSCSLAIYKVFSIGKVYQEEHVYFNRFSKSKCLKSTGK